MCVVRSVAILYVYVLYVGLITNQLCVLDMSCCGVICCIRFVCGCCKTAYLIIYMVLWFIVLLFVVIRDFVFVMCWWRCFRVFVFY